MADRNTLCNKHGTELLHYLMQNYGAENYSVAKLAKQLLFMLRFLVWLAGTGSRAKVDGKIFRLIFFEFSGKKLH